MAGRLAAAAVGAPALLPFIKAGKLRCIATGTSARLAQLPDVATVAEQGYKGFEMTQWYGLMAPSKMAKANIDKLEKEVREQLEQNPNLEKIQGQVQFVREKEGLRIEIIDKADFSMFGLGTSQMQGGAQELITEVAKSLAGMNNKIAVRGHTDSLGFAKAGNRTNWSLSAERAEATRAMFEKKGIKADRFAQIEGVADTMPYNNNDPKDPRNRRISVTVKYRDGE